MPSRGQTCALMTRLERAITRWACRNWADSSCITSSHSSRSSFCTNKLSRRRSPWLRYNKWTTKSAQKSAHSFESGPSRLSNPASALCSHHLPAWKSTTLATALVLRHTTMAQGHGSSYAYRFTTIVLDHNTSRINCVKTAQQARGFCTSTPRCMLMELKKKWYKPWGVTQVGC